MMVLSFFEELLKAQEFNIFLRLFLAIILGTAVGLSKELFVKATGFRVSIVVTIASALVTLVGIYQLPEALSTIIGSIIITTGLIILGIINNHRGEYEGLVSSCLVLLCAAIGVTSASGLYFGAICTTLLTFLIMFILKTVEKSMVSKSYLLNIIVDARKPVLKNLLQIFESYNLTSTSIESRIVLFERNECVKIRVEFIRATSKIDIERIMPVIKEQINPLSISLRNDTYGVIK